MRLFHFCIQHYYFELPSTLPVTIHCCYCAIAYRPVNVFSMGKNIRIYFVLYISNSNIFFSHANDNIRSIFTQLSRVITSLAKEVMFLVALVSLSVCLCVCLFVCGQHYSKSYERIGMKFYGWVLSSTRKN